MVVIAVLGAVAIWVAITQDFSDILLGGEESPWPVLPGQLSTWLLIGPAVAAVALWGVLTWAGVWTRGLGLEGGTGLIAGAAAVALGAGAAAVGAGGGRAGLVLGAVAVVGAVVVAVRALRTRREVRENVANLDERARVRREGTRVRAEVSEVRFTHTWVGSSAQFHVVASTPVGERTLTAYEFLFTEPEDAPVVGGTVYVFFDPAAPETMVLEVDEESIKDPEAARTYAAPSDF